MNKVQQEIADIQANPKYKPKVKKVIVDFLQATAWARPKEDLKDQSRGKS